MHETIEVTTTTATKEEAENIAQALVHQRLAACAQVSGPVISCYRWQGAIETNQEWRCIAKTHHGLFEQVQHAIVKLHSYEVPEILATPIVAGSADYLQWLERQLTEDPE